MASSRKKKRSSVKRPAGKVKPRAGTSRARAIVRDDGNGVHAGARALPLGGVESPAKAKTIGKYLGHGFAVKATVGHIRDLPTKTLGIDLERGFEPEYVTIPGKEKTVAELK